MNSPQKSFFISPLKAIFLLCVIIMAMLHNAANANHGDVKKPLIGIMLNDGGKGGYSDYPWYAMRQNYGRVIAELGGIPVFIGHDTQPIDDYIQVLDGILLTGGDLNTPEGAYTTGIKTFDPKKYPREYVEFQLVKKALEKNIPVLGICAGMQDMNLALGGTLIPNLKEVLKTPIQHRQENREKLHHSIAISEKSQLYKIVKTKSLKVNSNHRAGINKVSPVFVVTARAPDGVIEGFEVPGKRFFMGVMWHPEFMLTPEEKLLWKSFIQASSEYRAEQVSLAAK